MHSGWSRHVLMTLMNELPWLVDLFAQLPSVEDQDQQRILLSLEGGHPRFLLPSTLPSHDQLVRLISHHLVHLLLQHPFLDQPQPDDPAWHLALDAMVDQLIPSRWQRFSFSEDPTTRPDPHGSLFQTWTWYVRHPDAVQSSQIEALEEHRLWKQSVGSTSTMALSSGTSSLSMPEPVRRMITEQRQLIEALQWRSRLTTRSAGSANTRLTWTHHRRSRRYGTFPGVRIKGRGELVIILDTSGSMAPEDIRSFFDFLPQISRLYGQITMVEADHLVRVYYPYRRQTPAVWFGRGDTFFQPALDFAVETHQPDAIWYVTDGQGTPPRYSAPKPLTWLICGDHADKAHLDQFPGNYLYMKNNPTTSGVINS